MCSVRSPFHQFHVFLYTSPQYWVLPLVSLGSDIVNNGSFISAWLCDSPWVITRSWNFYWLESLGAWDLAQAKNPLAKMVGERIFPDNSHLNLFPTIWQLGGIKSRQNTFISKLIDWAHTYTHTHPCVILDWRMKSMFKCMAISLTLIEWNFKMSLFKHGFRGDERHIECNNNIFNALT